MIDVTCAIILKDNKILVTQRSESMNLPLKWEFPGGKIEEGETAENCLLREIKEELDIEIELIKKLPCNSHDYGNIKINLIPFLAKFISGEIKLAEHATYKLLTRRQLKDLDWADADLPIVEELLKDEL